MSSAWPPRRPDLIRSWATDIAGAADPAYVWHDMAQVWQTPGDGEAFVDAMMTMPMADRAAALAERRDDRRGGRGVRRGRRSGRWVGASSRCTARPPSRR